MLGLTIAVSGTLIGAMGGKILDVVDLQNDAVNILFFGLEELVLIIASTYVCDIFILSKFNINKEIMEDKNVGTGLVVGGLLADF